MRILLLSGFFFIANFAGMHMVFLVSGKCLGDQKSLLLQLKDSLIFDSVFSTRLVEWSPSTDCCAWNGTDCDEAGHIIGLDLSDKGISGGIENATGLFGLQYLRSLNLAFNFFNGTQIPSSLADLKNLTYLNLSSSGFQGQIPDAISSMRRLITLDLSTYFFRQTYWLKLEKPNLSMLVENLTELKELILDGVNISASGKEWRQALSSSLPNLQVLSLSRCFPSTTSLQTLITGVTNIPGELPDSSSIANLTQLVYLDLSYNHFNGSIPSFRLSKTLTYIDLSSNFLTGAISSIGWDELSNLVYVDLSSNSLVGKIPPSLFSRPSLKFVSLANNQFEGQVPNFSNTSSLVLEFVDLSGNRLEGHIPMPLFELGNLQVLSLSYNNLTVQLDRIQKLESLSILDLSCNRLSESARRDSPFPPRLRILRLASCNLSVFPNLKNLPNLHDLDLSDNRISGKIPNWIWAVGSGSLASLNVSHNLLVGLQEPYFVSENLLSLDLNSNFFQGEIPHLPPTVLYVDYSSNMFSTIPVGIGNFPPFTVFFSLSNNSLKGEILESFCKFISLQVLDLSSNNLRGTIPRCLIDSPTLVVLNLRGNNLNGSISDEFPVDCAIQTLNLNGNHLEGTVPKSLANCKMLRVLDLGNNQIVDDFPCWLNDVSNLQVLVLRSNKFNGEICCVETDDSWSKLQIVDLSFNNFSGRLPQKTLMNWKSMTGDGDEDEAQRQLKHLKFESSALINKPYYHDAIIFVYNGLEMVAEQILTDLFPFIDLSSNHFEGPIPKEIGQLKSIYVLNLSHNALTGQIPSSIGNLQELESLDLSFNNLSGKIPSELASLNFLSALNLSYNRLVGRIPLGAKVQSFSATSFEGNEGLCGPPLADNCTSSVQLVIVSSKGIDWQLFLMTIGFTIGFGAVVTPLIFSTKVNKWHDDFINKFKVKFGM